ncbi:MAG: MarR family transcriptional regulator [Anaerolineae bacterium]
MSTLPASHTAEIDEGNLPHQQYRLFHDIYVFLDAGDTSVLTSFQLSPTQYRLLFLLDAAQGQNLIRLAERMLVARSTITRLIDQMEAKGLVQRVSDPNDRRAQRVALTPKGSAVRSEAFAAHEASLLRRFEVLTAHEQEVLRGLLAKLRNSLLNEISLPKEGASD